MFLTILNLPKVNRWRSASECAWGTVVSRDRPVSTVSGSLSLFSHHGVPHFFSEYGQLHPASSQLLPKDSSRKTVLKLLFLIASVPLLETIQFYPMLMPESPVVRTMVALFYDSMTRTEPAFPDCKQICSCIERKFIEDTEKSVV